MKKLRNLIHQAGPVDELFVIRIGAIVLGIAVILVACTFITAIDGASEKAAAQIGLSGLAAVIGFVLVWLGIDEL